MSDTDSREPTTTSGSDHTPIRPSGVLGFLTRPPVMIIIGVAAVVMIGLAIFA